MICPFNLETVRISVCLIVADSEFEQIINSSKKNKDRDKLDSKESRNAAQDQVSICHVVSFTLIPLFFLH